MAARRSRKAQSFGYIEHKKLYTKDITRARLPGEASRARLAQPEELSIKMSCFCQTFPTEDKYSRSEQWNITIYWTREKQQT
jgi:hypothetical protein